MWDDEGEEENEEEEEENEEEGENEEEEEEENEEEGEGDKRAAACGRVLRARAAAAGLCKRTESTRCIADARARKNSAI